MNPISLVHDEARLRWRAMRPGLNCAALIFVLTFFGELPSYAYSWYSGASVGSNGTVYGWGVTDGTTYTMDHIAYVWTTLTSPVKHRQAGPAYNSAQNSVRADVSLPFDPGDLGTYLVQSTNQVYCHGCLCDFINAQSQAQVTLCDFTIQGVARPLCNGSKSKTVYQAAGIPSTGCSVVEAQSNLTFVVGGDVTATTPIPIMISPPHQRLVPSTMRDRAGEQLRRSFP